VRFARYGGPEVLEVVDVEVPPPGPGEVLVAMRAAGINPGEAAIREGALHDRWPATFPSGQGSDLAGTVEAVGDGVDSFAVGDDVLGFTDDRASHAEEVVVQATNIVHKPPEVAWEQAGGLKIAGTTAYASVQAVEVGEGDVVVVSGAAGGVGSLTVQLARLRGATVIGLASEANHGWLTEHGVIAIDYGQAGLADAIRAAAGSGAVDAFLDNFGGGYIELALGLNVSPQRINTIIDHGAARKHGAQAVGGSVASTPAVLAELAGLMAAGRLEVPVAAVYRLDQVGDAYRELEQRHTRGKIVLVP
jgi:NADPH:quinone reductase-like Zn-dependent oxidoreductase